MRELGLWLTGMVAFVLIAEALGNWIRLRADRDRLTRLRRVAGGHVCGDGACPHPGTSGPGHPPDDPTARPITAQVGAARVTFTPVRSIAPRARIYRKSDGRWLSKRESEQLLATVFGESR